MLTQCTPAKGAWLSLALLLGASAPILVAAEAWAQAARSSGGYSRPSSGSYGRTPSLGGSRVTPRTPSTSGGYGLPSGRRPSLPSAGSSADRGYARDGAASALDRYRAQTDAARRAREAPVSLPRPAPGPTAGGGWQDRWGSGTSGGGIGGGWGSPAPAPRTRVPDWYRDRGWQPSGGGWGGSLGGGAGGGLGGILGGGRGGFGVFDGLFLWYLLDNITRPGHSDFFRNQQDAPGYRDWRATIDRQAQQDPALRQKLDTLDREIAARPEAPRDPAFLPPGVPPEIAVTRGPDARTPSATSRDDEEGGLPTIIVVLVLAGGAAALFFMLRRRAAAASPKGADMGPLATAGAVLRRKIEGGAAAPYVASRFRVGMSIAPDPTPFLLAAGGTKAPAPDTTGGPLVVQGLGRVEGGRIDYLRLRVGDQRAFFQLHLDAKGDPDECRWFAPIDEITPADPSEWGVWLDEREGLIGWPEFQTQDGKVYARLWAPGSGRTAPRVLVETIEGTAAPRTRREQSMLYAGPTGLAAPAPEIEYILVAAVEQDGQAFVEVLAGLDINPAALTLA